MVPLFLAALLAVRGLPALLYRGLLGTRDAAIADLLQSTSLPFIVAATAIGLDLGVIDPATSAALIAAGLLSVVIFPAAGLALLRSSSRARPCGRWPSNDSSRCSLGLSARHRQSSEASARFTVRVAYPSAFFLVVKKSIAVARWSVAVTSCEWRSSAPRKPVARQSSPLTSAVHGPT